MKKLTPLVSLLLLLVMALTACGAEAESTDTIPGPLETDAFDQGLETPVDLATPTEDILPTPTEEAMETPVETPEATPTESEGMADEATATTEVLAPTGDIDPGRISVLLDFSVENESGEEIGEVEDFILDLGNAQVDYVVVNQGGLLSTAPTVAVPWAGFEVQTEPTTAFVLLVDQAALEEAPEFDQDLLPDLGVDVDVDVDWDADFRTYWDTTFSDAGITVVPDTDTTTDVTTSDGLTGMVLASELLGAQITMGAADDNVATVEDAIVDIETGDLQYLVVAADLDDAGDRWMLIPMDQASLGYDATTQYYTFDVNVDAFSDYPYFDVDFLPDTQVDGWDEEIESWWNSFTGGDDSP